MKRKTLIAAQIIAALAMTLPLGAAEKLGAKPGSKMRLEGTSNIHDWQVEGKLIGGYLEVDENFPLEPGKEAKPGKVVVKGEIFVPIRSMSSLEKDGRPYSTKMDDIMYEKLLETTNKRITFYPTELVLKEAAKDKTSPYVYDAKGNLAVAGVTNEVSFAVNVVPQGGDDRKIKISGTTSVKMSAFKIEAPAPKIAMGMIKTGDDVKLIFDWVIGPPKKTAQ
ncbi:MAG: YceI family protein [Verrucomicrobiota bacterium]|jgi:hypothetical protein|nr:YceI family protein [Verrucomicrobiota bacterium]